MDVGTGTRVRLLEGNVNECEVHGSQPHDNWDKDLDLRTRNIVFARFVL